METTSGSTYFMIGFNDGSSCAFFHATDVEKLSTIALGSEINFIPYTKGTWNNGKDISTNPPVEVSNSGDLTLKSLLLQLINAINELTKELKKE